MTSRESYLRLCSVIRSEKKFCWRDLWDIYIAISDKDPRVSELAKEMISSAHK